MAAPRKHDLEKVVHIAKYRNVEYRRLLQQFPVGKGGGIIYLFLSQVGPCASKPGSQLSVEFDP